MLESLAILPNVYYTPEEASQLLRVSPEAVFGLLEGARVAGVKIDHQWRILDEGQIGPRLITAYPLEANQ